MNAERHVRKVEAKIKKNRLMRFFPWFSIGTLIVANVFVFGLVLSRFFK